GRRAGPRQTRRGVGPTARGSTAPSEPPPPPAARGRRRPRPPRRHGSRRRRPDPAAGSWRAVRGGFRAGGGRWRSEAAHRARRGSPPPSKAPGRGARRGRLWLTIQGFMSDKKPPTDGDSRPYNGQMELVYSESRQRAEASELSDRELALAARGGNMTAFETLVVRKTPAVVSLARRVLGNAEDARDVAQMVFVRVWEQIGRYDD